MKGDLVIQRNKIYNMDCLQGLKLIDDDAIDLTITSPPYDNLRKYNGYSFDFENIAKELYRVTKDGGILVWVVGDSVSNGSETGKSFRQALYFKECGFKLHDTMIYEKNGAAFPAARTSKRYTQIFEYMFVFCKGKIRDDISLLCDKENKWGGHTNWGNNTQYDKDGKLRQTNNKKPIPKFSLRNNIWKYSVGFNDKTGHPAVFPEKLAEDHILSWSVRGDVVLDPFMGSGTTAKMCILNGRDYIGFEISKEYCDIAEKRVDNVRTKIEKVGDGK
mgnify:FL=1